MRAKNSRMMRCLALLLAVLLVVPAMSVSAFASNEGHIHNHADEHQTLGQLIVSNYGDVVVNGDYQQITAAEKVILNSGALLIDPEFDVDTPLGTGNVTLNAVDMSITAKVIEDNANNCVWVPVDAGVYVDSVERERVALTPDGAGNYAGHYTFDGSAFYVVVNYQLVKTLTAEEKQNIVDLLNIAYELSLDLDVINLLVSKASVELVGSSRTPLNVLSALTDTTIGAAMGLEDGDTIIDLIYKISEGTLSQTIELPFESEELGSNEFEILIEMRTGSSGKPARDAAAALKGQMDANGGKLDLSQFFASHSLHSYLEIVGKHSDELDTMLDALYTNLSNINGSRGLGWTIGELGVVIEDTIPAVKEEAVDWINEQLTALQAEYPEAGIELITSLDDLAKVVENLKAERAGMLNLINKTLAQFSAMYPAAGLPASVSTVEELQALKNTLTQAGLASNPMFASFVASLDAAIEALPVFDAAIANMEKGMSLSELDALQNTLNALELLNEVLDATCAALEPVVDNAGQWKTGTYLSSENSAVYTSIMNAVTEAAKADAIRLYVADDIAGELVIAEGADQANMSMSDVTITVELNVVDAANNYFTHSLKKVITVEDGTTAAELKSAVTKFETEAVEQWTAAGIFVEGKYVCSNVEIPDVITGADSVVVTYDPAKFTVDMLGQVSEKDYGWTISLPIHPDSTKAYDYMVNGVHYMQGSSLIVDNDLVITREEGDGYTAEKLFPMVSARFDEYLKLISTANAADGIARVKAIINSGALGIENTNIYVRYPKNCVAIAGVENSNDYIVTAQPYEAVYNGAEWIPVSVTVFEGVNGQTSRVVTDCNEVGGAYEFVFTSNTMHHVVVNYSLSLADLGLTDEYVKDTMNEIMEVYNDVVDQLNDLQYLVNTLEYLKKLNSTVLENAKNLTDNPDTIAAIDQMMANNLDVNGNMILTTYLNDYLTGTPKGLEYYYANFSIIDAEVQSLKGPMEILGKDTALLAELDAFEPGIGDKVGSVTETIVAIDLTGPDENLNNIGLTNLLNAIGPSTNSNATFTELPYLEAGDALPGGEMTLESSLSLAGPGMVKVVINVTVVDIFKNRTTQSTTPITITAGGKLTTEQINALIAAVEAINPNVRNHDPMDDPETVEVEPLYSEAGLRELLAAELEEDLVISYYWERFHDCEFTAPTCTQASYCIYCKVVKGEPDTVNGHTWDAGVESLAPTCEKTGLTLFTCAECGGTTTEAIPALGHVFGEYISDGNVTCSTLGTKTAYCTREGCNIYDRVVDEETPLLPHTLSGWSKVDGGIYHTRSCHDCDYTETAAHNWDAEGVVYAEKAPTCTESGWRTFTCSDCGETKDEVEPATGHDFDYEDSDNTWVSSSAGHARPCKNGCGALGTTHAHTFPDTPCDEKSACDVCGYIKPAGEHKWGAWVKVDEHTHERTCPTCGDVETASHNWNDGVVTTAPTCTEKGEKTYTCNDCGATYTEEVEPTGHSYVPVVTAPTCTEQGYTTFTCSVCGHSYKDDYVDATGHSYGDWTVIVEPTCTEPGEKRRFCGKCGSYETEEIPAAGHNYIPVVTDPTCTEEGYTTYTCSVCGDTYVDDYVGTTDHEYGDWYETLAPTCTEPGEERRDCEHCTAFETREVPAAGHSYDSVVTPPTCTEQGYTTYTCHCGDSYVADYVDATGHEFGDWYETLAPTCSAKGEERRDCKNGCGEFETREVPMVDHNFASGIYLQSADGHAEKCTECDAYGPVKAHTWNTNDCEATDAECTVCHYVRTAGAHSWSDWTKVDNDKHERFCSVCSEREEANHTPKNEGVVTTEPTCSEPGVRTHTCFDCGDTYTEEIPATGIHVYDKTQDPIVVTDPTCDTVGEAYYPCIYGCGEKEMVEIPATGHDWDDGVETTAPDCENPGVKTYTCRNDATHTYTEEIPALGHDYQVTGTYDEDGHEVKCSRCGDTITVDHEWEKVGAAQDGIQAYKCICGAEKTENVKPEVPETGNLDDFNHTWDRTNEILKVDVPDTNGNYKYAFDYTIYMGTYGGASTYSLRARAGTPIVLTIRVNSGNEFYTINLNNLLAEQYPELFGGPANADALADFVYNAWKNPDSVVITCELVDLSENELVNFVSGLNAGSSSALKFSLVQNADGSYTIVANVANADGIQGAFVNVATALVFNGIYNKIGMKSWAEDGGYETVFGNGQLSIQALINGFLYEDGFGTGTIVNAFTETGAINPAAIQDYDSFLVGSQSSVGALIQTAHMSLGNSTEIKYEVDFHLTMSQGSGQLLEVRNLLDTAEPILTAETRRGKMQVTLKEKIYEIYQAEMLLTGGADKNQPVIATNEDACKYLHEYLKVLMGKNVNVSTYENTLEKLGQSRDLSKHASILNLIIDEFGKAQLSSDCLSINLARNAKTTIDKLMSKFNIAMNTDLLGAIKEYGDPNLDLSVVMTAVFEPAEVQFGALIIDLDNNQQIAGVGGSQYLNKFDFAKIGEVTSRINTMADRGAVMLFADVNGNLVFNGDAILDLNGKTINGNIVANGKLFIVDSSMDTTACGMVNGSVTTGKDGVVYITGGKFRDTLPESYLKNGYVQGSDKIVVNELYTITEKADGEYTITLHSSFATKPSKDMGLALGIDLLTDMLLNDFEFGAMTITGGNDYEVYNITLNELLSLYAGTERIDQAIGAVVEDVDFENIRLFINDLLAGVLDFESIAATYEDTDSANDGVVVEYTLKGNHWDIVPEHVAGEDYIEFHLEVNAASSETKTLTVVIDGEMAEALFAELGEIADATATVDTLDVVYNNQRFDIGLVGNADVTLNLTGSAEKHDTYVAVIAVVLAKVGNTDLLNVLNANGNTDAQHAAFNNVSVKDVISALKAIDADTDFADLAAEVGLANIDSAEMDALNTAYQALGYTAGALLNHEDITGSSTQKMGALDPDGDGTYVFDDFATNAYTDSLNKTKKGFTVSVDGAMTAKLTLNLFEVCDHVGGTATCKTQAVCDICGCSYGELDANNHEGTTKWVKTAEKHSQVYTCCGAVAMPETDHVWTTKEDVGKGHYDECTICYYRTATVGHNDANGDHVCDDCQAVLGHTCSYTWYDNMDGLTHTGVCRYDSKHTIIGYHNYGYDNVCDYCGFVKDGHCPSCEDDGCHTEEFQDLNSGAWYHEYTDYVICKGIMIGISTTEKIFDPTGITTRAMLVTTLYRDYLSYGGTPVASTGEMPFDDVAKGAWYTDAVIWAAQNGIVLGYGNGKFGPSDTLTREQSATIFYRYAKFCGFDSEFDEGCINTFDDYDQVSSWAEDGVKWAVTQKMMNGRGSASDATLSPDSDLQRAEIAALLYRWFVLFED